MKITKILVSKNLGNSDDSGNKEMTQSQRMKVFKAKFLSISWLTSFLCINI